MARFVFIVLAGIYVVITLYRIFTGKKINIVEWILLLIGFIAMGSMISYIIQSN